MCSLVKYIFVCFAYPVRCFRIEDNKNTLRYKNEHGSSKVLWSAVWVIFHIKYTITHSLHIKIQPIIIALKVSKKKNSLRGNLWRQCCVITPLMMTLRKSILSHTKRKIGQAWHGDKCWVKISKMETQSRIMKDIIRINNINI